VEERRVHGERKVEREREKGRGRGRGRTKIGSYGCVTEMGMGRTESGVGESTGCFIMQKLSRQLGRSGSTPLHYPSSRGGGGGGGGSGIQEVEEARKKPPPPAPRRAAASRVESSRVGASERAKNFGRERAGEA